MAKKKKPDKSKMSDKQFAIGVAGGDVMGVGKLAEQIKEQNKIAQDNKSEMERNEKLNELIKTTRFGDSEGKAAAIALKQEYKDNTVRLQKAIESGDKEQIKLEESARDRIIKGAETEEKRREAVKATEKQSKLLGKISSGISGLVGFAKDNAVIAGGGVFAALALFNPELMEKIINKVVEVLSNAMKIIKAIINPTEENGGIEGALKIFKDNFLEFGSIFAVLFGGKLIKMIGAIMKVLPKIRGAFLLFKTSFIADYIAGMMTHFKDMMKALGGKLLKLSGVLLKVAKGFRVFLMATFIPGMLAALSGTLTSLGAVLVPMLPMIGIGLAIAAVVGLIYLGLTKLKDALGFSSVFDLVLVAAAHMKDAFAHLNNFIAKIVNFIGGLIEKGGKFLGFDFELPKMEIMATDNAAKKVVELREKAKVKAAEEEAEKKKSQALEMEKPAISTGDDIDLSSLMNSQMAEQNKSSAPVIINQKGGDVTTNTTTNTTRSYRRRRGWRSSDIESSYA